MKVPYSWLKEFVNIENISVEELSAKLVSCGFEIEEVIYARENLKNIVVGEILEIKKHDNSDHLSICQVDVGKTTVQIVTGASNINVADRVPVALDGAVIFNGTKINTGELRGVLSQGMMCSGEELGLEEDDYVGAGVYGILILDKNSVVGMDINDVIDNNEVILDVGVTANRPDCNSILGIAREVSAVTGLPLNLPNFSYKTNDKNINDYVKIENQNFDLCPRYKSAAVIDVKQVKSPKYIRDRLKAVGIRPINNLVDVTNYVLTEIGQPMHAFDLNNLSGGKIIIRNAYENEKIVALDGKEYSLKSKYLAICDEVKPVAIAGVMGGEYSSICEDTNIVVLESAKFARDSIRHTSRELNLKSDSSARYEKGIDFISQDYGIKRALSLFDEHNWGSIVGGEIDLCKEKPVDQVLKYSYKEVNAIIGKDIEKQTIVDILNSLTLTTTADGDILTTTIPNYREDMIGINDITEEVIRMYGYDFIQGRNISNTRGGKNLYQEKFDKIKNIIVSKGAYEIITYSFIPPKAFDLLNCSKDSDLRKVIAVANPLGVDFSVMRTTLSYSMIKTIANNFSRGNKAGRLFEIAKTYIPKSLPVTELPEENFKLSIGCYGDGEDYYSIKNIVDDMFDIFGIEVSYKRYSSEFLHPGRSASISISGKEIGYIGEVHPDVNSNFGVDKRIYIAELDVDSIINVGKIIKPYKAVSKYQAMERDLALLTPNDICVGDILDIVKKSSSAILENAEVFDVYSGGQIEAGFKSVAIKLTFRDINKTLKDEEVNVELNNILQNLADINVILR